MKNTNLVRCLILSLLILAGCSKKDIQTPAIPIMLKSVSVHPMYPMVPNELLIKFKSGVDQNGKTRVLGKIGGKHKEKILTKAMEYGGDKQGLALVNVPGTVDDAIAQIINLPEVENAEPNYIYTNQAVSDDPYFSYMWGMFGATTSPANQYGCQAAVAWAAGHTGSKLVYVGIIDSGYMYYHEDLNGNAGVNKGEGPDEDGIDNDGNGYIDDIHGWNFVTGTNDIYTGAEEDIHGTHVAGIIGAVGGNRIGVAGVCWNVRLLNAKIVGPDGGTLANAIKAVDYFTKLKQEGVNIVATNNSWSGGGFSQSLQDAIERANEADVLFIAAAGNDGINTEPRTSYPSGYPNANIIAVASINSVGELSSFSNYAPTKVDLGAPGENIASCIPPYIISPTETANYAFMSGTSMAAPFVTGAAALYASTHPGAKAAEIKAAILNATIKTKSLNGRCLTHGRLDVSGF